MKNRKHVFCNRQNMVFALMAVFMIWIGLPLFPEEIGWGCFWLIFGVFLLVGVLLTPCCHVIDSNGIRIYYMFFLFREEFRWENIAGVEVRYGVDIRNPFPYVFDTFEICGVGEGKEYFFMHSEISRTRRAKRLIERHMGQRIEGFFIDDIKATVKKWSRPLKPAPDFEPAKQLEREARLAVRTVLEDRRLERNITLFYIYQRNRAETSKRPNKNYTYVLKVTKKTPTETKVILKAELVSIKVGRRKCHGEIYHHNIESLPMHIQEASNLSVQ